MFREPWREQPAQMPGGRRVIDFHERNAAFGEGHVSSGEGGDDTRETGFVADDDDAVHIVRDDEFAEFSRSESFAERLLRSNFEAEFLRGDFRRFRRTRQWAAEDEQRLRAFMPEKLRHAFDFFPAVFCQRPLVIGFFPVWPIRLAMAQKINIFHGR